MREIKFRAWDKESKRMRYDFDAIAWVGLSGVEYDNPVIVDFQYEDDEITRGVELMQYTGLKDKNGKEIYVGDIVKIHTAVFRGEEIAIIEWHKYGIPAIVKSYIYLIKSGGKYQFDHLHRFDELEIIGNIYENKDLLTCG